MIEVRKSWPDTPNLRVVASRSEHPWFLRALSAIVQTVLANVVNWASGEFSISWKLYLGIGTEESWTTNLPYTPIHCSFAGCHCRGDFGTLAFKLTGLFCSAYRYFPLWFL